MEIYILDEQLRRVQCIDLFQSLIWSERYSEKGDFTLILEHDSPYLKQIDKGTKMVIKDSFKVCTVDAKLRTTDDSGALVVKITGYTDEHILDNRLAKANHSNLEVNPTWDLTGTPRDILKEMVYAICIDGILSTEDKVPYLKEGDFLGTPGSWMSLPNLLFWEEATGEWSTYTSPNVGDDPLDEIVVNAKPQTLYTTVKEICDVYDLGFRIVRNYDNSELYFEVYTGQDRTSLQTFFPTVRFSVDMDNLVSTSELTTDKNVYNVAYVYSKRDSEIVYAIGEDADSAKGFARKVMYVEVTEYDDEQTAAQHTTLLKQRGAEELAKHRPTTAFDGEISKNSTHKYGRDYELGDLVEMKSDTGVVSIMRVVEQIFVHDLEGERSYPTLAIVSSVDPNTWQGVSPVLYWSQAEGYWVDWV